MLRDACFAAEMQEFLNSIAAWFFPRQVRFFEHHKSAFCTRGYIPCVVRLTLFGHDKVVDHNRAKCGHDGEHAAALH
jgi:hypothetical protein